MSKSLYTPAYMKEHHMTLTVWCVDCRHNSMMDFDKLPAEKSIDCMRFRCTQCLSHKVQFIVGVDQDALIEERKKRWARESEAKP